MCIVVLNKKGLIKEETLWECWMNNPDSFGFAYVENKQIHVRKFIVEDPTEAFKEYFAVRMKNKLPILLHFRIATHGKIDTANCHPFYVSKSLVFAHNGIISIPQKEKEFSDTVHFNRNILQHLPEKFYKDKTLLRVLSMAVGSGNKLAFLDNAGYYSIVNARLGLWDGGNWYSNTTYKPYDSPYYTKYDWSDIYGIEKTAKQSRDPFYFNQYPGTNDILNQWKD